MIQVSHERNDRSSEEFWNYILQLLNTLKHDGMSDEEDADQVVTRSGVTEVEPIKQVLVLKFQNPYFRGLFELVDKAKGLKDMVFNQSGRVPMKRIRVDTVSSRQPPKGLSRNFLHPEFLASLLLHEQTMLHLKKDFELRHFDNDLGQL